MGIKRPVRRHLPLNPQRFSECRQQQLDSCRAETDAVIEALDAVFGVDPLDGEHGNEDLGVRNFRRIARKQRLYVKGVGASTTKSTRSPGISTRGTRSTTLLTCATTMPLLKWVASTMVGVSSVFGPV